MRKHLFVKPKHLFVKPEVYEPVLGLREVTLLQQQPEIRAGYPYNRQLTNPPAHVVERVRRELMNGK